MLYRLSYTLHKEEYSDIVIELKNPDDFNREEINERIKDIVSTFYLCARWMELKGIAESITNKDTVIRERVIYTDTTNA
jgi:hypothetical protein